MADEPGKVRIGLWSGVGLVVASMVGAGVLTSNGFMAGSLPPRGIFLVWVGQAIVAVLGAIAYSRISQMIPRSGGEYRYLSDLVHPFFGYLAGWTSLLIGFAAPVATNAIAAGIFARQLHSGLPKELVGGLLIVFVTVFQIIGMRSAKWAQNSLVAIKALVFLSLIVVAVVWGSSSLPESTPQSSEVPLSAFAINFFFAAYAFSGWNASIYAAEEFSHPKRDVARSMIIGVTLVTLLYLAITYVFLANLPALDMASFSDTSEKKVTIAHLMMGELLGPGAAGATTICIILVLVSSTSAMTFIGPRVNAAMAGDGYLPKFFIAEDGKPPVRAILTQSAVAILLMLYSVDELMQNVGIMLTFVSALTVLGLLAAQFRNMSIGKPGPVASICAFLYAGFSAWILYYAVVLGKAGVQWILAVTAIAAVGFLATRKFQSQRNRS